LVKSALVKTIDSAYRKKNKEGANKPYGFPNKQVTLVIQEMIVKDKKKIENTEDNGKNICVISYCVVPTAPYLIIVSNTTL